MRIFLQHSELACNSAQDRGSNKGFTLIELLVVLVIIGLFVGMVTISIGDNFSRQLRGEAERLQSLLMAASDESVFAGAELGFLLRPQGYQLLRFDPIAGGWAPFNDRVYHAYEFPSSIVIDWQIDGFQRPDGDKWEEGDDSLFGLGEDAQATLAKGSNDDEATLVNLTPQLLVLSSGEMSVFIIEFSAGEGVENEAVFQLKSDGFSMPTIKNVSPNEE